MAPCRDLNVMGLWIPVPVFGVGLPWQTSEAQEATEWESLYGETLDLFFEDRALSVLSLGEEMKL